MSEFARFYSAEVLVMHTKLRIGDSMIETGEAHGRWQPMPSTIYLYLPDADAVYRGAMAAGATSLSAPADQRLWRPFGGRKGHIREFLAHRRSHEGGLAVARGAAPSAR